MVMKNRGAMVIIVIAVMAFTGAGVAVWWHHQLQRHVIENWGSEHTNLIRHAPIVEVLKLRQAGESEAGKEAVMLANRPIVIADQKDISQRAGFIHARHALIVDATYLWDARSKSDCESVWTHAVRFRRGDQSVTLVLDFACNRVELIESEGKLDVQEQIMNGLKKYTVDVFQK